MSSNNKVLLVSSDNIVRDQLYQYSPNEFVLDMAINSSEAIEKIHACNGNYDVILVDQMIGQPDNREINNLIYERYPSIARIIISNISAVEPEVIPNEINLSAYCYISRPVNVKDLKVNIYCAIQNNQEHHYGIVLQTLIKERERAGEIKSNEDLYKLLYNEAKLLLPGLDGFLVSHYEEQDQVVSFPFSCFHGERNFVDSRKNGNSITEFVIRNKEPLLLPDGDKEFRKEKGLSLPYPGVGYCTSEVVVPMFLDKKLVGTINVITYDPNINYTKEHLQVLRAFANQAVEVIRNVQQLIEAKQLRDAALVLSGKKGKDEVLWAIVEGAHKLIDADFTGLILQDANGFLKKVKPVIPESFYDLFDEPRQEGGITRKVIENKQLMVILDTYQENLVKSKVRELNIRSMLALPLIHADRVLGVLYAHTIALRYFSSHDVDLWTTFATQAAAALDMTLEEERHIQDYMRLANELGTLNEKMELSVAISRIATSAKKIFGSDTCRLAYIDSPTGRIINWSWAEDDPEKYRYEGDPRPDGLTYYVLGTKKPFFHSVEDTEGPHPIPALVSQGLKSFASLPLIYSGRTIGVLHFNYLTKQQPFDERLKTLMEAFVARAAMALDRARRDKITEFWHKLDQQIIAFQDKKALFLLFTEQVHLASYADLTIFCPYNLSTLARTPLLGDEECIVVGNHQASKSTLIDEHIKEIFQEIEKISDKPVIENNIEMLEDGRYINLKRLADQEGFNAFIAIPMSIMSQGSATPQLLGMLSLFFKGKPSFELGDISELQYASNMIAASIMRQELQFSLQRVFEQRNQQLRAIVDISEAFIKDGKGFDLNFIMKHLVSTLGIHACSLLEYDPSKEVFIRRGTSGGNYPDPPRIISNKFYERFNRSSKPTIISDVRNDEITRSSKYVKREGIKSSVIFPLRVEGEFLGLLFANYRTINEFSQEEIEAIGLFGDLAAMVIHELKLGAALDETQQRLNRRFFLVWVSMIEATWRHSLVQKAAAIRNHTAIIQRQLSRIVPSEPGVNNILGTIADIDRLAEKIANAPPRVPQSWEMNEELLPLRPLLEEVAKREGKPSMLQTGPVISVQADVKTLGNVEVSGYRAWLVYALEALLQNARSAMPNGGEIFISGSKNGKWVEVRIQDTGDGVPEAIRSKLFKELTPKDQDSSGMGIGGLLIATIIEDHRGNIELENPGPGNTTILIRLPIPKDVENEN